MKGSVSGCVGGLAAASSDLWMLLLYTLYSLLRMFVALIISYLFAVPYGIAAARSSRAEKVLMPLLDVLQSVPILGFFPAAIFFFIAVFQETWVGIELASIFLVFTSQAWNLAFAVYEAVSAIPAELEEASSTLRLGTFEKIRRLYLPACVPKLVYNGMMSWAGGWYFLVAAEMITIGSKEYRLPGIGRYLAEATYGGDYLGTAVSLTLLVATILIVDIILWQPLRTLAERYKYEAVSLERASHYTLFHLSRFAWFRSHLRLPYNGVKRVFSPPQFEPLVKRVLREAKKPIGVLERYGRVIFSAAAFVLLLWLLAANASTFLNLPYYVRTFFEGLRSAEVVSKLNLIPAALGLSVLRLLMAYFLSVAWTLPLAVKIAGGGKGVDSSVFTALETLASIPATALFPVIVVAAMKLPGGFDAASVILTMTGMQWYLLFNLIGGARSVPSDLIEAAQTYGVKGLEKWRKLLLPAMLPSFVTGSITAWGGGWNALVVSEYAAFGSGALYVTGIGALLDIAAYELGSISLLIVCVSVMVVTIIAVNRLLWRRLYRVVLSRCRLDQ